MDSAIRSASTSWHPPEAAPDALLRLAGRGTVAGHLRAGTSIVVHAGRVWLTQSNDANDYFVSAGERHVVTHAGRVVIEADSPSSTLRIGARAPAARPGFP